VGPCTIDVSATLAAVAQRQIRTGEPSLPLRPSLDDLQCKVYQRSRRRLIVFALDLSDSMGDGLQNRMGAALGAALTLTRESYLNRDLVSLVTFRDNAARVIVPPTGSVYLVRQQLKRLAIGGATPLGDGLRKSLQVIRQSRVKLPGIAPLLVVISDGEATSPAHPGGDPIEEAVAAARALQREDIPAIMIDTSSGLNKTGIMPRLAEILGTRCHHLQSLTAGKVLALIDRSES
jgi:magnesium chelatase subunit D